MAVELTLTRCAISIFFLRTFYTKMYPWLRRTGTYPTSSGLPHHGNIFVDTLHSVPLHRTLNSFGYRHYHRNAFTLPTLASQLGTADTNRSLLLQY